MFSLQSTVIGCLKSAIEISLLKKQYKGRNKVFWVLVLLFSNKNITCILFSYSSSMKTFKKIDVLCFYWKTILQTPKELYLSSVENKNLYILSKDNNTFCFLFRWWVEIVTSKPFILWIRIGLLQLPMSAYGGRFDSCKVKWILARYFLVWTLNLVILLCSGEKMPGVKWSESIEVKGKVKLDAFEKYIQDLPRSRNRGLMVRNCCYYIFIINRPHSMLKVLSFQKNYLPIYAIDLSEDMIYDRCPVIHIVDPI